MYRTALEAILGLNVRGDRLSINPCIPRYWKNYEIVYRHGSSRYRITIDNPHGVSSGIVRAAMDGEEISHAPCDIDLIDDGGEHGAIVTLG
jgi:cyclic beta-1,2-glucan synthetase